MAHGPRPPGAAAPGPNTAGFTLVEVLVVIALIGILATQATVLFGLLTQRASAAATTAEMSVLRRALLLLATHCDGLPTTAGDGGDPGLAHRPAGMASCWNGPYVARWPGTTRFGVGSYRYQGAEGTPAVIAAVGLPTPAAQATAAEIAANFGAEGGAGLQAGGWEVSLLVGSHYRQPDAPDGAGPAPDTPPSPVSPPPEVTPAPDPVPAEPDPVEPPGKGKGRGSG